MSTVFKYLTETCPPIASDKERIRVRRALANLKHSMRKKEEKHDSVHHINEALQARNSLLENMNRKVMKSMKKLRDENRLLKDKLEKVKRMSPTATKLEKKRGSLNPKSSISRQGTDWEGLCRSKQLKLDEATHSIYVLTDELVKSRNRLSEEEDKRLADKEEFSHKLAEVIQQLAVLTKRKKNQEPKPKRSQHHK